MSELAEAGQTKVSCPSNEFSIFIESFLANELLQKTFTRFPYEIVEYDPQDLDGKPRSLHLQKEDVEFPLIFNRRFLAERGVEIDISKKAIDLYEVSTYSHGSGAFSRTYLFKKGSACWFLISMTDGST